MDRLTCRYDGVNALRELCTFDREGEVDDCLTCEEYCNNEDVYCEYCPIQKAFDKLSEYENLEEKGMLFNIKDNNSKVIKILSSITNVDINNYRSLIFAIDRIIKMYLNKEKNNE